MTQSDFRFPLVDIDGKTLRRKDLWGTIGFSERYEGRFSKSDTLIHAMRSLLKDESVSAEQQKIVRSFCLAWLTSSQKNLSSVVDYAIPLPPSVQYITRIGQIDRTVNNLVATAAGVTASVLFLEMAWDSIAIDTIEMNPVEASLFALDQAEMSIEIDEKLARVIRSLDQSLGQPGDPCARSAFRAKAVFDFLKVCRFRNVVLRADFATEFAAAITRQLDRRIFALFLANSRQIEGLVLSGQSEATAAVVAHAALALGLHDEKDASATLEQLQSAVENLKPSKRREEAMRTLGGIKENLQGKAHQLERKISRHVGSAMTTEAIDLATFPVASGIELLGTIASGLGKVTGDSTAGSIFNALGYTFSSLSSTVESTPDASSRLINGVVSIESWARDILDRAGRKKD